MLITPATNRSSHRWTMRTIPSLRSVNIFSVTAINWAKAPFSEMANAIAETAVRQINPAANQTIFQRQVRPDWD